MNRLQAMLAAVDSPQMGKAHLADLWHSALHASCLVCDAKTFILTLYFSCHAGFLTPSLRGTAPAVTKQSLCPIIKTQRPKAVFQGASVKRAPLIRRTGSAGSRSKKVSSLRRNFLHTARNIVKSQSSQSEGF